MLKNIESQIEKTFIEYAEKVAIYLSTSHTKTVAYDKFSKNREKITYSNPIWIKAIVSDVSPERLIVKEIGLNSLGAKKLKIKAKDVNLIKDAKKVEIDGETYSLYNDALGSNAVILKLPFNYYSVILFRSQK